MDNYLLNSLDKINRAMGGEKGIEFIINDVLDTVLSVFDCDRVWLFYPCDPNTSTIKVFAEKNKPEYPGAFTSGQEIVITGGAAETIRKAISAESPVVFDPESGNEIDEVTRQFSVLSQIMTAIHPRMSDTWMFGMHQCSYARVWSEQEQMLFKEISHRVVEGLNNLVLLNGLRKSEQLLRENEERYALALEAANVGTWDWEIETGVLKWSEQIASIFGLAPDEFKGTYEAFLDCVHPEDLALVEDSVRSALTNGTKYDIEHRIVWPDKSVHWVTEKGNVLRGEKGKPKRMLGVVLDITGKKEAFERFRTVLDSLEALVYVADMETYEVLFVNKYGRDIWGDIVGKTCWHVLQKEQTGPCGFCTNDKLIDNSGKPLSPYVWEFQNTIDKEWYECRDQAIEWHDGRIVRLEIAANITSRKVAEQQKVQLEEKLLQAQKMEAVGTLAGGIAHDFNNILSIILGYTDLALAECQSGSNMANDLEEVFKAAQRASDLVKQILAFSRQAQTERIVFRPAELVKEAVKMLRPSIPVTIEIELKVETDAVVLADPTHVHQILMNLCTNAFHAMENSGGVLGICLKEIELEAKEIVKESDVEAGRFIQISVSDTGPGIAPNIIDKIFDPYMTTKESGKGTGLGLSVVHGLVKSYGGFITLDSEQGKGTIVHVYLPAIDSAVEKEDDDYAMIPRGAGQILYVDDEVMLAKLGQKTLERCGYKVSMFTSSRTALEVFSQQPQQYDLVLTDQTMPGMTGAELAKNMLEIRPDIPIILCTGYSSIMNEEKAREAGIKELIMKPFSAKDIAEAIHRVLENSAHD